jgi:hypothetical protein
VLKTERFDRVSGCCYAPLDLSGVHDGVGFTRCSKCGVRVFDPGTQDPMQTIPRPEKPVRRDEAT